MWLKIKYAWQSVNASYWFYPALFSVLALALAVVSIWLDRNGYADFLNDVKWLQPARPTGATNILTVAAGSMIGVASTVFSITIAAVAYASGNYGPRLLTNFMENRGNQLSLATFIATFVYTITVLRSVRTEGETSLFVNGDAPPGFVPQLSLLIAYALLGLSIVVLVYFLNHVPASIRINTVLEGIGSRLLKDIRTEFPETNNGDRRQSAPEGIAILATRTGYVQLIDFDRLERLAKRGNGKLRLAVRNGDFVHPDVPIAYWADMDDDAALPDDDVRDCFGLGAMRTPGQDMDFLIDEIVEIALRALSPGINDPFTAVTALHWLGAATAELARRRLDRGEDRNGEPRRVLPLSNDFTHYVGRGFGSMRGAVATSRIAAMVMFDALVDAATTLDDETRRAELKMQGDLLAAQMRENLVGPDRDDVEARYRQFLNRIVR